MQLFWFMAGVGCTLAVIVVNMIWRLERFRRRACTSCGRKAARKLVEVYDFDTNNLQRGILCNPCARYSDQIPPPPWA